MRKIVRQPANNRIFKRIHSNTGSNAGARGKTLTGYPEDCLPLRRGLWIFGTLVAVFSLGGGANS